MASKSVSPVDIVLSIKGSEKLQKLNSSFRDLSKQLNKLSAGDLQKATDDVRKFAAEAGNSEATIRGQIKAFEGLREQAAMGGKVYRELGISIGNLKSTLRGSTDELEQQRAGFVKTGNAAKSSAADIKAVISQLEVLKGKARPGSSAFAQIAKDIDVLQGRLKEVNIEVKKFNAGFETSQRPAMNLEKIQRQIGRLSEGMKTLNFTSNEYLQTQTRIALLGQVQSRSVGRQQVRANAEMFSSAAFQNLAQGPAGKLGLPNTAAALNLEISELQTQLANTAPGESYKRITQGIASKQADLNKILNSTADAYDRVAAAQSASTRRAQKIADLQEYARSSGLAPGAGGYRDPQTGAIIARGRGSIESRRAYRQRGQAFLDSINQEAQGLRQTLALPAAGQTTAPGTGLERSGGALPLIPESSRGFAQESFAKLQGPKQYLPGPALPPGFAEELRQRNISETESIRKLNEEKRVAKKLNEDLRADVSKARIANNDSVDSVNRLRSALDKQRNTLPRSSKAFKELSDEIGDLDRRSEKVSRRMSRRKFSPGKAAQVAGATISGGIFGGPEGFLGGALGGALGGVGGSFAGAALGAQVGQLRQQLGGFADYAASIERLKIALNGIAGDASNYNRALQAAATVTEELNVPQEVAIRGMTRLTAAVQGAGGGVADAELAFKNINSAIIATGGGAEQVQGAVTALVQIFSKGKVSAEEINQIAERLPGTFNKIAEASGRTGPELTKALQKGEVGLNDLMKFLVQLGGEYGELAKKIAASSESAGARLTVAYDKMRLEIGKALQPIGAEFQSVFASFATEIAPKAAQAARSLTSALVPLIKNLDLLLATLIGIASGAAIGAVVKGIIAIKVTLIPLIATLGGVKSAIVLLTGAMALNPIFAGALAVGGIVAGIYAINKALNGQRRELEGIAKLQAGQTYQELGAGERQEKISATQSLLASERKKSRDLKSRLKQTSDKRSVASLGRQLQQSSSRIQDLESSLERLTAPVNKKSAELTVYDDPTGTGTGTGKVRKSQLPQLQDKYDSLTRSGPLADIQRFQIANSLALVRAQKDNNTELIYTIKNNAINLDFGEKELGVKNKYLDAINAANATEDIAERQLQEKIAKLERDLDLEKLIVSANGQLLDLKQDQAIASETIAKASEDELFNLRDQLGLVSNEDRIDRFRQSRKDAGDPNAEQQTDLFRQRIDPTLTEGLSQNIRSLKKELEDLVNPINQITGAANAIGTAFSQSFTNAITGATSAKQALSDFFKSVGSYFLDMAGQIIAKMVTMAVLNTVVKLLPGGGLGSFNAGGETSNLFGNSISDFGGGSFGGFMANGGPVSANTPYIVGERGPELMVPSGNGTIIPNDVFSASRAAISGGGPLSAAGNSGDLGKDGMAESRNYISNNYSTQQAIAQSQAAVSSSSMSMERVIERKAAERQATEMSEPIRVKLDTTVINNVEYLTVEQGLALSESASRKARSQVFSDLRQRPASRSKVGLG